jgi:asparagine synthase (glutamine-hydrolysing)
VSAILGVFSPEGRPVDRADLDRMLVSLAHRGPDGASAWIRGPVGLGHRMLRSTPESLRERLPRADGTETLVLTADARIDNRDELISALGLTGRPPEEITDGALILAAYERWGEGCPRRLLGDFAFAIWDARRQALFCARDHFGVKPFYYHSSTRIFAFSSELKAVLCLPAVPRRLNEARVADYLAALFDDTSITFYQDLLRLPPGHTLTVSRAGVRRQAYWSLDPARELRLGSDEEYAEAFREILTEAVRCRLRRALPIGSLLSGGLDSSSITCVARKLMAGRGECPLPTFSAIFGQVTECDERRFIQAVVSQGGLEPHYVHGDAQGPLTDLERILWHEDEAFYAPGLFLNWRLYGAAREQGVRVLLDGFDGDSTVSHGYGYLNELAHARRWLALAREVRGAARGCGASSWGWFRSYLQHYGIDPMIARSRVLRRLRRIGRAARRQARDRASSTDRSAWSATLNPDFVRRMGLEDRHRDWRRAQPGTAQTEREEHYRTLTQGVQPFALEVLDRAAAAFAIEPRYPFWDRRLVEFCLSLPPEQKLHRGWGRRVMRRAMTDLLPPVVQWRRDKSDFLPNFSHGLLEFERERLDRVILDDVGMIESYVNVPALRELYGRLIAHEARERPRDLFALWKAVSLALWLRYSGATP